VALDAAAVARLGEIIAGHASDGGIVVLTTHQAVEVPAARTEVLAL
jgi:ABC-type transport system involved in cytochrome c biogenesis ATPase subunit